MTGPGFHEFLIRSANDRLLTDRDEYVIDATASDDFVDFANLYYEKVRDHYESGAPIIGNGTDGLSTAYGVRHLS